MHVTSLEIILGVVAVFIVFGPKKLPHHNKKPAAIKIKRVEHATVSSRMPAQYAAGRALSPLQQRAAERPSAAPGTPPPEKPQFADGDHEASPLPHELLRV